MPYSIHRILILLVLIPEAVAITIGIIRYRRLSLSLRYLFTLVAFGFATDIIMRILGYYKVNNHFIIGLYIPVEFLLLGCIYRQELHDQKMKRVIPWLVAGLAFYALWTRLSSGQPSLNPGERFFEGLFVVCFILLYFHQTLKYLTTNHLEHTPMFWLSAGLFIYFACDIIIFIFSNFVLQSYSKQFNLQLWDVHAVLTMILYFFYTLALWVSPKN